MKDFHMGPARRMGNFFVTQFTKLGIGPGNNYLLTTMGRKSGRAHTNPVIVLEEDGRKYLVAPYGPVDWVANARAAGSVTLQRRSKSHAYSIREVEPAEAAPILKRYVKLAPIVVSYFEAEKDSPLEDFAKEAHNHPVFELTPG